MICWVIIAAFVGFTFWAQMQQAKRAALAAVDSVTAPNLGLEITGRLVFAQSQLVSKDASAQGKIDQDNLRKQLRRNLASLAVSPLDKLKAIVLTRELLGPTAALDDLNRQLPVISSHPQLLPQARLLQSLYTDGPQSLSAQDRQNLIGTLGWFGSLAVTQGLPADAPERMAIIHSAQKTFLRLIEAGVIALAIAFLGLALLMLGIILFSLEKMKFRYQPLQPLHRPVFLESFALWGVCVVVLSLVLRRWKSDQHLLIFEGVFLLMSFVVALWPLTRGMDWQTLRHSLGWHLGAGPLVEIGAGVLGYIAGLPVLITGLIVTLILSSATHTNPTHPISQDLASGLSVPKLIGLLLTISLAAPLLEETLFRGALYGHLRQRCRAWVSAGVVSLIFAAIHPQGWTGIPVLASIAIVLATLREWRGSLIAPVVAHAINNAAVLLFVVVVLK